MPEDAFGRTDETPDEEFYRTPRLVTHIDDRAIDAVTQLYRELFSPGGEILDLMSSWISHLPSEVEYGRGACSPILSTPWAVRAPELTRGDGRGRLDAEVAKKGET